MPFDGQITEPLINPLEDVGGMALMMLMLDSFEEKIIELKTEAAQDTYTKLSNQSVRRGIYGC